MYGDLSHDERKAQTVVRDSQSTIRDPFDYIRDREKAVGSRCRDSANLAGGEHGERPACSQPATRRAACSVCAQRRRPLSEFVVYDTFSLPIAANSVLATAAAHVARPRIAPQLNV